MRGCRSILWVIAGTLLVATPVSVRSSPTGNSPASTSQSDHRAFFEATFQAAAATSKSNRHRQSALSTAAGMRLSGSASSTRTGKLLVAERNKAAPRDVRRPGREDAAHIAKVLRSICSGC